MTGKYFLNSADAFGTYGLTFRPGIYNELLKLPKRKPGYEKSWTDQNGTERDLTTVYFESRTLNIPVTISAKSESEFYSRYAAFTAFIMSSGYFNFDVVEMNRRFSLLYQDMTSFDKLTIIKNNNEIYCDFNLQLIDDFPTTFTPIVA